MKACRDELAALRERGPKVRREANGKMTNEGRPGFDVWTGRESLEDRLIGLLAAEAEAERLAFENIRSNGCAYSWTKCASRCHLSK